MGHNFGGGSHGCGDNLHDQEGEEGEGVVV
jgi:hypothetical protein